MDYPPPALDELSELLDSLLASLGDEAARRDAPFPEGRERFLKAALGLTLTEAEAVLAKVLVRDGALTDAGVNLILAEKKQIVRRSGLLEYYDAEDDLDAVGGLHALKEWLRRRRQAFTEDARRYGLALPQGVLLLGVQGCGKSLVARAISREWQMPLLRLDVGRIFGRYIGESEAAIRTAIRTAEAVAPSILWIDEIEKGFAGATVEAHDTGVSARVLGTFLTWMQEKGKPVFVVATANQVRNLPPELLRKGRFDELFLSMSPGPTSGKNLCGPPAPPLAGPGPRSTYPPWPAGRGLHRRRDRAGGERGALRRLRGRSPCAGAGRPGARGGRGDPDRRHHKEAIGAMRHWAAARARKRPEGGAGIEVFRYSGIRVFKAEPGNRGSPPSRF